MAKKAITFVTAWSRYNAGETAAFDPDQADDLIAKKKAVLAKDQPKSVAKEVSISLNVRDNAEVKAVTATLLWTVNAGANVSIKRRHSGLGSGVTRFYFARARDQWGNLSPFSAGAPATTT